MTELQAAEMIALLTDTNDWLSQITTHIYWISTVMFPLVAFCLILWWVLKRYMY